MRQHSPVEYFQRSPEVILVLASQFSKVPKTSATNDQMHRFLETCGELRELERMLKGFNLFSALGITEKETRHSRLLAWLLDPKESHGHGTAYLERFFSACLSGKSAIPRSHRSSYADFEVHCESDSIDILIVNRKTGVVCAIENKIHASQGRDQLARYRRSLEADYPNYTRRFIFLTLNDESPADPEWVAARYDRLLEKVIGPSPTKGPDFVKNLLFAHYVDWINAKAKPTTPTNLFRVLNCSSHELRHSDFLSWLLDQTASHGYGDAFLKFFLGVIEKNALHTLPQRLSSADWSDAEVRREFAHIDLLVLSERNRLGIIVENKVKAKEREAQLEDYRGFVKRHFAHEHLLTVFLDVQGRQSSDENAVNLSYNDLLPFFESRTRLEGAQDPAVVAEVLVGEYRRLLTDHLWIKKKTKLIPPPAVSELAISIVSEHTNEVAALIGDVREWQKGLGARLGNFLLQEARRLFSPRVTFVYQNVWFKFSPADLDRFPSLTKGGVDPWAEGRIVQYEFFVVPFGNTISVRPPQLSLDVKLLPAGSLAQPTKDLLHVEARNTRELFNRAEGDRPSKFDHLLNHELCSVVEVATLTEKDLQNRLRQRLERFHATTHQDILRFFKGATDRLVGPKARSKC